MQLIYGDRKMSKVQRLADKVKYYKQ